MPWRHGTASARAASASSAGGREQAVNERRQALDVAVRSVEQTADPQTEAASHIVAWVSRGLVTPSGDDFAMLRLILLALLPQVGGILLMIARH
jgi:hypothetical protein